MLLSIEHVAKLRRVGPHETPTLRDVSLSLGEGDFVGVWGQRRSGKTTLLRIAAGLEAPDAGRVRFDGRDLATLPAAKRTQLRLVSIGIVTGEGPPCSDFTVLDYVAFPLLGRFAMKAARERAMRALRRVAIEDHRDAIWDELADSERALVSLAHGLVREPRLLLVDDPVVGLDPDQQSDVVDVLRAAAAQDRVAVLMTSSVLSAIAPAHEAYTLGDGRLSPVAGAPAAGKVVPFPGGGQTA